jgi:hypothetical protein
VPVTAKSAILPKGMRNRWLDGRRFYLGIEHINP